jgi:DNA-binding transcriptional MerR regulator
MSKLINISEASKILNLVDPLTKKPQNHILRYWEKEFKEIRPKKINNRRYYTSKQLKIIEMIKFLLKTKGMTISGVKKILSSNINKLDDHNTDSLKTDYYKTILKKKSKTLLEKINKIKFHGKKNSS